MNLNERAKVKAISSTGTRSFLNGPRNHAKASSKSLEALVKHTTKLAATRAIMRTPKKSPCSNPPDEGCAMTANTTEKPASTYTGTSIEFITLGEIRATAARAKTPIARIAIPIQDWKTNSAIDTARRTTSFTRASQRLTGVSAAAYVNLDENMAPV